MILLKEIKWGIIGLGNIAGKFAKTISKMTGCKLSAVASRNKEKALGFGKKYNIDENKCYSSYKEIMEDDDIEVIYIAVPHPFHKEISLMCLNNKKAVLCEKPVTMNEAEITEVVECAKKNKTFFMEAMKTRFLPVHRKAKEIIESGQIGEVRLLQADFGVKADFDPANRLFNKKLGGGALLDVGSYCISYSAYLFGNNPLSVTSNKFNGKSDVDENVSITLNYENGITAQLYGSINLPTRREANIIGTKGRICIPRFSSGDKLILTINGKEEIMDFPFEITGFEYQIEEVNQCLRSQKLESNIMSWQDSIAAMKIIDKVNND